MVYIGTRKWWWARYIAIDSPYLREWQLISSASYPRQLLTVVSPVESGRSMTRLTMDAHRLTGFFQLQEFVCWVTVLWQLLFFWATKVMANASAVLNVVLSWSFWWPMKRVTLLTVMVFVFRVPVVVAYLHDRHAKKNAPYHRSAVCWENWLLLRV